ncbi:hypothetical protein [Actinocatenispora rupis]|uniref:Uncharacterized protein n=1 Tax=Actinocatenispora rupis TaxID=519421 RepID=A0A8J3NG05_9ACTN|nr:hypothetical protein [Actinocatenispora rupis]GID15862.1 hypothetical protein Aru02nite_67510 [Actinocatenispora rupis]
MTSPATVADAADVLRTVVRDILSRLGVPAGTGSVTRDVSLSCDARSTRWEYSVRASTVDTVDPVGLLRAGYGPAGWRVVDRSSPREQAVQLSRDGYDLGVHVAGRTVVAGGSTPCFRA